MVRLCCGWSAVMHRIATVDSTQTIRRRSRGEGIGFVAHARYVMGVAA